MSPGYETLLFSQRVTCIDRWNRLEQSVIDSATMNAFKTGLSRTRNVSIGFFTTDSSPSRIASSSVRLRNQVWPHLVCTWYVHCEEDSEYHYDGQNCSVSDVRGVPKLQSEEL